MGVFENLRGLLLGRSVGYSHDENIQLRQIILERTRRYSFPIVSDMDFGHTSPQFTLPIGCRARIHSASQVFEILEPGVA